MLNKLFIINTIFPISLKYNSDKETCELVCIACEDIDEKAIFISTRINLFYIGKFEPGTKINLIGKEYNTIITKKNIHNSFTCNFEDSKRMDEKSSYYTYDGKSLNNDDIMFLAPRPNHVRIMYTLESIKLNGGFPKESSFIFKYNEIMFIKVDEVKLECSTVNKIFYYDEKPYSEILNVFIFRSGPKVYHAKDIITVEGECGKNILRTPGPEFLFTKVYTDDCGTRLMNNNETMFLVFDKEKERTMVFVIDIEDDIRKFSKEYIIKEN